MRIVDVSIEFLKIPLKKSYVLSSTYGVLSLAEIVVVRLLNEDGLEGWGETAPLQPFTRESAAGVMETYRNDMVAQLLAREGDALIDWWQSLATHWPDQPMARAAIDIALHDLFAKAAGQRVYQQWGNLQRQQVSMMGSVGNATPEENGREAAALKAAGYTAMMVKVGTDNLERDIACVASVRAATGSDFPLIADANQGWDRETAIQFARAIEPYRVSLFEQPVASSDWEGLKQVRDKGGLPVCADESLFSEEDAKQLIRGCYVDAFSIKVTKHGGLTPARRIMALAADNGIPCLMNSMIEQGIAQGASLQLAAVATNLWPYGHAFFSTRRMAEDITDYSRLYTEAGVRVPGSPGHGVKGLPERFAAYRESTYHERSQKTTNLQPEG